MKGIYKIGIVFLMLLTITTAMAITEIGDNIIATWVNASFFKGDGALITNINRSNIVGQVGIDDSQNTSINSKTTLAEVNQSANLYNINASNITSGQIPNVLRLPLGTVILINANETDSGETSTGTTTSEITLMTYNLSSNSYTTIIVETEVEAAITTQGDEGVDFQWKFNESTTNRKTLVWRVIARNSASAFERRVATLKTSFPGGQVSTTTLKLTGQITYSTTATSTFKAHSFRVYGVV